MTLQPGTSVTANVRLVEQLGEGGMGSVWVADHQTLHTRVAVKFISAELVKSEPSVLERFKREAALCAQIKSPNVVQTFDHGVMADGRPYIVMELLDGESLQRRLDRQRVLSFQDAKAVVTQTCKALGKAHRLGIVHRDIKPDNLYLTPDDDEPFLLKVLDFGIAKQTGMAQAARMTSTGSMVGTPEYMSPEQVLSGNTVDFRSDLWAVAVVAYHCLTGAVPFQGETLGSLCVAIANGRFRAPSHYRADLLPSVDRWFERALSVDPAQRHGSTKELALSFCLALTPNEAVDEFATAEGFGSGVNTGAHRVADASTTGPTRAVPAFSGLTPSPVTVTAARPGEGARRTLGLVAVGGLSLAAAVAYFLLAGAPDSPPGGPTTAGTARAATGAESPPSASPTPPPPTASAAATPSAAPSQAPSTGAPPTAAPPLNPLPGGRATATPAGSAAPQASGKVIDRGF